MIDITFMNKSFYINLLVPIFSFVHLGLAVESTFDIIVASFIKAGQSFYWWVPIAGLIKVI